MHRLRMSWCLLLLCLDGRRFLQEAIAQGLLQVGNKVVQYARLRSTDGHFLDRMLFHHRRWLWLGLAVALAVFLPNLIWITVHHFPHFLLMRNHNFDRRPCSNLHARLDQSVETFFLNANLIRPRGQSLQPAASGQIRQTAH